MEADVSTSTTTICSLNRLLPCKKTREKIDDFVRRTTITTFLASLLMNAHLLRMTKLKKPPIVTQTLCFRAQLLVSDDNEGPRKKNSEWEELEKTYRQSFPVGTIVFERDSVRESTGIVSGKGLSQIRKSVGIQMLTNYNNYNEDALEQHQRRYLEAKHRVSREDSDWMVRKVRCPVRPKMTQKRTARMAKKLGWSAEDLSEKVTSEWKRFGKIRSAIAVSKAAKGKEEKKEKYHAVKQRKLELRYDMLKTIEELDPDCETSRRFTLFPVNSLRRKFIRIDKKVLNSLISRPQKKKGGPPPKELTVPDVFQTKKVRHFNSDQWEDETKSIVTNGYQAHTTWISSKRRREPDSPLPLSARDSTVDIRHIRGVDPGNHSLVVAARVVADEKKPEIFSVSKREYYENCGTTKTNRMIRRAKRTTDHGRRVVKYETEWSTSTLKTTSWEKIKIAIESRLHRVLSVVSFYFQRKWAARRFLGSQKKARELSRIAKELGQGVQYVSFGNGSFKAGIKGAAPGGGVGDLRKVVHRLYPGKVLDCDEFCTSKICYGCDAKLTHPKGRLSQRVLAIRLEKQLRLKKKGKAVKYRTSVHGLCQCKTCHRTWNRDVNASLNMVRILFSQLKGRERPEALCRNSQTELTTLSSLEDTIVSGDADMTAVPYRMIQIQT